MCKTKSTFVIFLFIVSFSFSNENKTKEFKGFFDFSYDESKDKIFLQVDKLDHEFLYVGSLASGVGSNDIGLDRGQLGSEKLVKFIKKGNKLLLVEPNLYYRAETKNISEKKSVEQAFAKSVIFGFEIIKTKKNYYIIDFTPFLMFDRHGVAKILRDSKQGSYKVDKTKSAIEINNTKAFPNNVEFEALLTFSGEAKGSLIKSVTPDPDNVTVFQHHSFIKLPDNNYIPRKFDTRSGAISISYMDYSSPIDEPITKKYVIRHRLEKKNPELEISEAVEPIIYYLDPGTPEPVKSALLDGGRWWNQAYESIGFKDAFQVKMLPEGVDPLDCRYNVIQWVHRSTRGWSYGASVIDPRTGEIIKGQVSLGSLRVRQDYMILSGLIDNPLTSENKSLIKETALDRIRQLSAHEIGHTLGFAHNYISSANSRSSVMDYPHPKIDLIDGSININDAYSKDIGPWDIVSVKYAYSDLSNQQDESKELNKILDDAIKDGLYFLSDSDSRPVGSANPYSHLWDNGSMPFEELEKLLEIRKIALNNLDLENINYGESYDRIEDILVPIYMLHRYQIEATAKAIGGLEYLYFVKDNNNEEVKFVDRDLQKKSLESLLNVLSPENLVLPNNLINILTPRSFRNPRTRENFISKTGVTFDYINASSSVINHTMTFLLNPERINRINQQNMFGSEILTLDNYLNTISNSIFINKKMNNYESSVNNNTSSLFLDHLFMSFNNKNTDDLSKSIILSNIKSLLKKLKSKSTVYNDFLVNKINAFITNPDKYVPVSKTKIPDGSPIGDFSCDY